MVPAEGFFDSFHRTQAYQRQKLMSFINDYLWEIFAWRRPHTKNPLNEKKIEECFSKRYKGVKIAKQNILIN